MTEHGGIPEVEGSLADKIKKVLQRAEARRAADPGADARRWTPPEGETEEGRLRRLARDGLDRFCRTCLGAGVLSPDDVGFENCTCAVEARWARKVVDLRETMGRRSRAWTLDSYDPDCGAGSAAAYAAARRYLARWEEHRQEGRGVHLWGQAGCGKTHLAVGLCLELPTPYFSAWPFAELAQRLSRFGEVDTDSEMRKVQNVPVLLLDDLDKLKATEWRRELLYRIVDHRYRERLVTICTANGSPEELAQTYGEPVASRVVGSSEVIRLEGDDQRLRPPSD